jgi:hypothetical protein
VASSSRCCQQTPFQTGIEAIPSTSGYEKVMIELLTGLPENVIGFSAGHEITAADYESVLVPALETKLQKYRRVRLLYVIDETFTGFTGGAAWEDTRVGLKHLMQFERIALVTDVGWLKNSARALAFMVPCEVRIFDSSAHDDARRWISEPAPAAGLTFELRTDTGVLILRPHGELEVADFERVAAAVDPYIDTHGELNGVVIIADHFPGWDDLGAFFAHLRFVRTHRRKLKHLAIVSDDHLLSVVPALASHLGVIEARHFPSQQADAAVAWAGGRSKEAGA